MDKTSCTIVEKDGLFTVKGKAAPIVTPVKPALPDGTSDDVTAEIKPATAVVLGVDTTKSAITEETKAAAITDTMKVISADITSKDLTVNEETGAVEISVATASEAAKGLLKDNETLASKDIAPLPVFTADVEIGKDGDGLLQADWQCAEGENRGRGKGDEDTLLDDGRRI